MRHILNMQQFDRECLEKIFAEIDIEVQCRSRNMFGYARPETAGALCVIHFHEESFRTRSSFDLAAQQLGMMTIVSTNSEKFSTFLKGDSPEHTVRILEAYGTQVIIVRSNQDDIPMRMASVARSAAIINAGSGKHEHPTQAILDTWTIRHKKKNLGGITVAIGGDLERARVARSLAVGLSLYPTIQQIWVSHPEFRMLNDVRNTVLSRGIRVFETDDMQLAMSSADVFYQTRSQNERKKANNVVVPDDELRPYIVTTDLMGIAKPDLLLMHPGPIKGNTPDMQEIEEALLFSDDRRVFYFETTGFSVPVRRALIRYALS